MLVLIFFFSFPMLDEQRRRKCLLPKWGNIWWPAGGAKFLGAAETACTPGAYADLLYCNIRVCGGMRTYVCLCGTCFVEEWILFWVLITSLNTGTQGSPGGSSLSWISILQRCIDLGTCIRMWTPFPGSIAVLLKISGPLAWNGGLCRS